MSPPLVGVVDWRLPVRGGAAVELAGRIGADGVQLDLGGPGRGERLDGPGRLGRIREASCRAGVAVLAVAVNAMNDIGLMSGDAAVRSTLLRALDAAGALGAGLVFVPSFRRSAIDGTAALRSTAEVLRWAAAEAAARGLLLASENVLDSRQARAMATAVGSDSFRLLLDTYNLVAAGGDPVRLVSAVPELLADQIHVKDGPGGDASRVLAAVARSGTDVGALVLENDHRDDDAARLRRDLARLRRYAARFTDAPNSEEF
ncbi:TIM barrel protein [Saccharopolyspora sp. HNM0986]|uniref:TIM barrel protein n=1 Tax=Saccharopolyspora galaxeae TaxID=2781241 RepID=UPI00190D07F2|nr:TIM barrel protein [Saccharopolyspora sp. HNM0986]MBK0869282.1 TIM barrel protein [Saccharopolyspora sp. HNM0986]